MASAAELTSQFKTDQGAHAVAEQGKWTLSMFQYDVCNVLQQGAEPRKRRFSDALSSSWKMHQAEINFRGKMPLPVKECVSATAGIWKAEKAKHPAPDG